MSYQAPTAQGQVLSKLGRQSDLDEYYQSLQALNNDQSLNEKAGIHPMLPDDGSSSYSSSFTDDSGTLNRWPTLFEILNKKTQPPVDLWSFYVYMRDTQKSIDYLDFWIDTVQHMNLCKVYVKGLKNSLVMNEKMRDAERQEGEELRRASSSRKGSMESSKLMRNPSGSSSSSRNSATSSMLLDLLMKNDLLQGGDAHRLSAFLRGEAAVKSSDPVVNAKIQQLKRRSQAGGPVMANEPEDNTKPGAERVSKINPEMVETFIQQDIIGKGKKFDDSHFVTRATLRKSSKNIMNTYFMNDSEKRILIPDDMRQQVIYAIETEGRDDPEVFDESREYVFKAMEHEAYPNFLRDSAMCNVRPKSAVIRMFLAIFCAFAAFWTGYTLIFLNYQPKRTRAVVTIPFFFSAYFLFSAFYRIDPILCFLGFFETSNSTFGLAKIKEPFVKKLLLKRSLFILLLICLVAAAFSVLFALVPGKHLHH